MTDPSFSIVIPVKDDERIAGCLASVEQHVPEEGREVVVVSNGSSETFSGWLQGIVPIWAKLLELPDANAYVARNRGVADSSGKVVFLTDADCQVEAGWVEAGLTAIDQGASVVQGFSGSADDSRASQLVQRRYEAHLRRVGPGSATECDTRNMAVTRAVFQSVGFREEFRRTSDTEFGLACEAAGFRVAYEPSMRVRHSHEGGARLLLAKQVCHGWGSRRIMVQRPEYPWHSRNLRLANHLSRQIGRVPSPLGNSLARATVAAGGLVDTLDRPWLPLPLVSGIVAGLEISAAVAGQVMYRPGSREPVLSKVAGTALRRD